MAYDQSQRTGLPAERSEPSFQQLIKIEEAARHHHTHLRMMCYLENLRIWHHGGVGAGNVKIALHELPEAAAVHLRVVSAVHLCHVIALDLAHAVQGHIPGKGDCEVISQ